MYWVLTFSFCDGYAPVDWIFLGAVESLFDVAVLHWELLQDHAVVGLSQRTMFWVSAQSISSALKWVDEPLYRIKILGVLWFWHKFQDMLFLSSLETEQSWTILSQTLQSHNLQVNPLSNHPSTFCLWKIVDLGDEMYSQTGVCPYAVANFGAVCSGEKPDSSMLNISSGESRRLYLIRISLKFWKYWPTASSKWPWFDKSNVIVALHEP